MNDNIAVFTRYENRYVLIHTVNNRAMHIYVYNDLSGDGIGSVINCRIEKKMDGMGSSFVRFAPSRSGFINKEIKGDTLIPLMLKKEAYNDKKAQFTDKISIDGQYIVAILGGSGVKVSSKIPEDKKNHIIEVFNKEIKKHHVGVIVRTKAYTDNDGLNKAKEEFDAIIDIFKDIKNRSEHVPQYTVMYSPLPAYIKDVLYLCDLGIEEIVTDDDEIFGSLSADHFDIIGPVNVTDRVGLRKYKHELINLCNLYSFNAKISEALSEKVYLKSGAYISFGITEALCAIDVNSSGAARRSDKEETVLAINLEAAEEIARQLVLRNISGIIIIDFISMRDPESVRLLEDKLKSLTYNDRTNCRFVDFTGLQLAEIVRTRSGRSLYSMLKGK